MGKFSVPDKWRNYSKMGSIIPGTNIVAFKVPLKKEICRNLESEDMRFTISDLIEQSTRKITMIIDLTLTDRFYDKTDLKEYGIEHVKLQVIGGGRMPRESDVIQFCKIVDNHLKTDINNFIGVHCTHGLNRTGYFVCRYLIDYMGKSGKEAVQLFETSRGHNFDRDNYKYDLINRNKFIQNDFYKKSRNMSNYSISRKNKERSYSSNDGASCAKKRRFE